MSKEKSSRMNKYEKRRKNTKLITYLISIGTVLMLFLIVSWVFGGSSKDNTEELVQNESELKSENESYFLKMDEDKNESIEVTSEEAKEKRDELTENESETTEEEEEEEEDQNDIEIEQLDSSDDDNVKEAYTANWSPVGTTQTGPHTTVYESGSQDRIEINEAASLATGIPGDEMIEWWIGNGGDQKVVATVSDNAETEIYRVYLSWIDEEGWQPTKVETLITNDKK